MIASQPRQVPSSATRRLAVEGKAEGVKDTGFSGAGFSSNQEEIIQGSKINTHLPGKGAKIF
jgi:hypothetical protein